MTRLADTPRVLGPRLPLRTRARLRGERVVDGLAGWLCGHGRWGARAGEWVWRACRML